MLTEEATIAMPPMPTWYQGRDAVAGFLRRSPLARRACAGASSRWARAASSPSASTCGRRGAAPSLAHSVNVLTMDGARIAELIAFLDADAFARFGLPSEWSASALADGGRG